MITIAEAITDDELLGQWFVGESWALSRAVLKAAEGGKLDAGELALFRAVAGEREPPIAPVSELWIQGGRRSGKDSLASVIATVLSLRDYSTYLRPGEKAVILLLACDREQAAIVLSYIRSYFTRVPMLKRLVVRETALGLELSNNTEITVATNSFRSVRGRTIVCAIFDEVAFWRDETTSARPDMETYRAIKPGMATIPGALLVGISSPYKKSGLLYTKYRASFGKDDARVLFVKGATRLFNPLVPQEIIDEAIAEDPEAAKAEWGGEPRDDLSDYASREKIESCVTNGVIVRPPIPTETYVGFVDPSGGSNDSMVLAIAHNENDRVVVDCIVEIRAPFSPDVGTAEIASTALEYGVTTVKGDRYGGQWPTDRFAAHGIEYVPCELNRSELYLAFLPLVNSGRIELLDNKRMVAQFAGLERRTSRIGKDSIDHPRGFHDDISNAIAGVAHMAAGEDGANIWARIAKREAEFEAAQGPQATLQRVWGY